MSDTERHEACPAEDELEDYYSTGESSELASHVEHCEKCRKKLAEKREIDELIKGAIKPPSGLSERIKARVHEASKPQLKPVYHRQLWAKVAAVAVVVCICCFVSLNRHGKVTQVASVEAQAHETLETASQTVPAPVAAVPQVEAVASSTAAVPDVKLAPSHATSGNVQLVGINGGKAKNRGKTQMVSRLGNNVRHVWSVENVDGALAYIRKLAENSGKKIDVDESYEGGNILVGLKLSDIEVQNLVDKLQNEKWALVSPYLPQPGKADVVAFSGKPVYYVMTLVKK